jgi:hypothetical protein
MLKYEWLGILALGILWMNSLLVAGAALVELKRLAALRRRFDATMLRGRVVRGEGPNGELATQRIERVGRATDDGRIIFADRSFSGSLLGGAVSLDDGRQVSLDPQDADVWIAPDDMAAASACPSDKAFDEAFEAARKARGHVRAITATIAVGAEVFVAEGQPVPGARGSAAPTLSTFDPRAWCGRKMAELCAFALLVVVLLGAITLVALWPPAFGVVSTVGAILAVAFFLLVQPAGTAMRDRVRIPSRAAGRGEWVRSTPRDPSSSLASSLG